ncbi:YifB family Mg chelatase-like AAA ATPase [Futiania mangrovi]|uniref:YifB family Mg chelatase-like AAA ATPase n=1 Tax=Futiania mangrovi TaxID=2959716 RepID=A0A9J6PK05_9PROT|nr:YifB family Mg chelatase-like AAA ATPase [Futiania mangrovii]MCP1336402.1 YifB family Mg chelatase-like AAA ATPase [Futiania mangrovii]
MTAHVHTVAFQGIEAVPVEVQVQITSGLPAFAIVGLADKAVSEARERVRAALGAIGLALPPKRITVNLAPADLPKEGSHYDLPIALGVMIAAGAAPSEAGQSHLVLGELGLDGRIAPVAGVLPAAVSALQQDRGIVCPAACGPEAAWAGDLDIVAAPSLLALLNHLRGTQVLSRPAPGAVTDGRAQLDLRDIKGQESARRALEVAAAGGHNLLMLGPPGSGKSMLAARLPGLLPPLDPSEALEVSMIASVAGLLEGGRISRTRPYRAPHHSASQAAMVGGGRRALPGEVSLAHLGVLFLDELPEFNRVVLDSLRQPLETGRTEVARANAHVTYPSRVQLVAAMNPCRCGHLGDPALACGRAPKCARDYQARLSGPLLDRFDLRIEVPPVSAADLALPPAAEGSAEAAARIARARDIQRRRYRNAAGPVRIRTNAEAEGQVLDAAAKPDPAGVKLLEEAAVQFRLTARGYMRVLRVARTLADLDPAHDPDRPPTRLHVAEALGYRVTALA